jgi:hypothetical protein
MSKSEFETLLRDVYAPDGAWSERIKIKGTEALVQDSSGKAAFRLEFASPPTAAAKPAMSWRARHGKRLQSSPLQGLRVAIDPGHPTALFALGVIHDRLGNDEEAQNFLQMSFNMDGKFREIARYDPDLENVIGKL